MIVFQQKTLLLNNLIINDEITFSFMYFTSSTYRKEKQRNCTTIAQDTVRLFQKTFIKVNLKFELFCMCNLTKERDTYFFVERMSILMKEAVFS
jgi:hypothetical protein